MARLSAPLTVQQAVVRAQELLASAEGRRVIIGIAGAPGCGKSTLTQAVAKAVAASVTVGMDGFHLAHSVLSARGDVASKGAIDTFDGVGYVALLRRIRADGPEVVWAPEFRRAVEDAIAGAIPVEPLHRLVITEGNYLLVEEDPWGEVAELCDEIWYLDVPEKRRVRWLVRRHVRFGRSRREAYARATRGSDGINARLVESTRERADVIVLHEERALKDPVVEDPATHDLAPDDGSGDDTARDDTAPDDQAPGEEAP